jgi:hypothetical protein
MEVNATVGLNLVGTSNNKAIIVPLRVYGNSKQSNLDDG